MNAIKIPIFITVFFCSYFNYALAQNNLDFYLDKAKENSPLVHDNLNLSKVNSLEKKRLNALYRRPQISVSGNYLLAPIVADVNGKKQLQVNPSGNNIQNDANGIGKYAGYDLATSNGGLYQGLIILSQPLLNGGDAFEEQAEIMAESNLNLAKISNHDLEKLVGDQYILCLLDKNQVAFADSMINLLQKQQNLVSQLVKNSLLKQSDLMLVNIELQNYEALSTSYRGSYQRDFMDLTILAGIEDTTVVIINDLDLTLVGEKTNMNFLEKYRLDSLNLLANQKVFEAKYKPQLNLLLNTGLNAVYAPTIPNRFGFSAGLSFTWNLFDGGQKEISRKKTDIQLETVSFYKDNFQNQNQVRKSRVVNELKSFEERLVILNNQLTEYDKILSSYAQEIMRGQISIINYITTLKNRNMVMRDYLMLQTNRLLLINMYNYWNW